MATYSVTTNATQEAYLTYVAAKKGVTNAAYFNAEMARILARIRNEYEADDGNKVEAAYLAAPPATQATVKTALGL